MSSQSIFNSVIVGTGAVGTILASRLQASGRHHVTTVCRSNYEVVRQKGFKIRSTIFGDHTFHPDYVAPSVEDAAQQSRSYDFVILCTKAFPSRINSADVVAPLVSEHTSIVTMQNGVNTEDNLIEAFPGNPVFPAVIYLMSEQISPGEVVNGGYIHFIIGANPPTQGMAEGPAKTRAIERFARDQDIAKEFAADLVGGNIPTDLTDNIQGYRWLKLVWNASFNPVAVVCGDRDTGMLLADPHSRELIVNVAREIWRIGETVTGRPLPTFPGSHSPEMIVESTKKLAPYKPSMLQDHLNSRPMEHEVILRNPLDAARRVGVPAPHLESVYAILRLKASPTEKGLERGQTVPANL
ncbi:hypothetical protein IWQ60_012513 [Tieghemiomyces parasiticus]|uniref:2-dehydropantoate 2-reductase n=1 Tax=Tieghemiomyces parasiticus TaxID=78921 RepID=A0A9W8DKN8_9FUNG|nr:hypothetical protein IWQ60_012513 [Tieghemiomyces parasiticus]